MPTYRKHWKAQRWDLGWAAQYYQDVLDTVLWNGIGEPHKVGPTCCALTLRITSLIRTPWSSSFGTSWQRCENSVRCSSCTPRSGNRAIDSSKVSCQ